MYASLNNSHNKLPQKLHEWHISTNTHVQIDKSIFTSYGTHAMNYFGSLGIIFLGMRDAGRRGNKITD